MLKPHRYLRSLQCGRDTVFGDICQLLYPWNPFFRPNHKRILAAFTSGTFKAVPKACMHPKRLPLARKYCMHRWATWRKISNWDVRLYNATLGKSRNSSDMERLKMPVTP